MPSESSEGFVPPGARSTPYQPDERGNGVGPERNPGSAKLELELELELIQTQMAQKPMLRAEVYAKRPRSSAI